MKSWWKRWIYALQRRLALTIGNTAWEGFSHPLSLVYKPQKTLFRGDDLYSLLMLVVNEKLEPGDILLRRDDKYLMSKGSIGIPGDWKHSGLYIGRDSQGIPRCINATGGGVKIINLIDFFLTDHMVVLRPTRLSKEQRLAAANESIQFVGVGYDYDFRYNDDTAFYCNELIGRAYSKFKDIFKFKLIQESRFFVERTVLLADQIFLSDVDIIFISKEAKEFKTYKEKMSGTISQRPAE